MERFGWVLLRYYLIYSININIRCSGIFIWSINFLFNLVPWSHWWLHLIHWWCRAIWSTHTARATLFKHFFESICSFLLVWYFRFTGKYSFGIIANFLFHSLFIIHPMIPEWIYCQSCSQPSVHPWLDWLTPKLHSVGSSCAVTVRLGRFFYCNDY